MKANILLASVMMLILILSPPTVARVSESDSGTIINTDGIQIRKIGRSLIFEYENASIQEMKLTRDGEIFIDGEAITLEPSETDLAIDLYDEIMDLRSEAWAIGLDGAIFGVQVAAYAISSVVRSLTAALLDSDEKCFEQRMDRAERKIDKRAQAFEKRVESVIRKKLNRIEYLHNALARRLQLLPLISLHEDD